MISLIALILEETEEISIYKTYGNNWVGINRSGKKRTFKNRESATEWAQGERKAPHSGRPKRKIKPRRREKKQTYDYTPIVKVDMEKRM